MMPKTAETPYVETEILLAVLNDDRDRAEALYRTLSPKEIEIAAQAFYLAHTMGLDVRYGKPTGPEEEHHGANR